MLNGTDLAQTSACDAVNTHLNKKLEFHVIKEIIMSENKLLAGDLAFRTAIEHMDQLMAEKGVSSDTRSEIKDCLAIIYQYIPYAIEQGKNPTDSKVLAKFLAEKGMKTAKLFGNDGVNCGISIVEFLLSVKNAVGVSGSGFPPAAVMAWGFAVIDLIDVGNSCEFAQQAYYDTFLKESSVRLNSVRVGVEQYYSTEKNMCMLN